METPLDEFADDPFYFTRAHRRIWAESRKEDAASWRAMRAKNPAIARLAHKRFKEATRRVANLIAEMACDSR